MKISPQVLTGGSGESSIYRMDTTNNRNSHNERCENADGLIDLCSTCWEEYLRWEDTVEDQLEALRS